MGVCPGDAAQGAPGSGRSQTQVTVRTDGRFCTVLPRRSAGLRLLIRHGKRWTGCARTRTEPICQRTQHSTSRVAEMGWLDPPLAAEAHHYSAFQCYKEHMG